MVHRAADKDFISFPKYSNCISFFKFDICPRLHLGSHRERKEQSLFAYWILTCRKVTWAQGMRRPGDSSSTLQFRYCFAHDLLGKGTAG
jgi:hypothetical protein